MNELKMIEMNVIIDNTTRINLDMIDRCLEFEAGFNILS